MPGGRAAVAAPDRVCGGRIGYAAATLLLVLRAGNRRPTSVELSNAEAVSSDKPMYFFVERYAESYAAELDHFVTCIEDGCSYFEPQG